MGENRDIRLPFIYTLTSYLQDHDTPLDPIGQDAGGIVSYSIHGDILYIEEIFTARRHRHHAILIALLTALLSSHPQAISIHLVTRPRADQDSDAMAFYTTLGFVPIRKCNRIPSMTVSNMDPGTTPGSREPIFGPLILDNTASFININMCGRCSPRALVRIERVCDNCEPFLLTRQMRLPIAWVGKQQRPFPQLTATVAV